MTKEAAPSPVNPFHYASAVLIANPTQTDIAFGRGRSIQEHTGNHLLNSLVEATLGNYNSLERKKDKTMLSRMIVKRVKESGGRFLKPTSHDIFRSLRHREKTIGELTQQQRMNNAAPANDEEGQEVLNHYFFDGDASSPDGNITDASFASFCSTAFVESPSLPGDSKDE